MEVAKRNNCKLQKSQFINIYCKKTLEAYVIETANIALQTDSKNDFFSV